MCDSALHKGSGGETPTMLGGLLDVVNHPIPAEVVDGGGGADPIVVDAGPGVSVAREAGGESSAPHRVRFGPVLLG